MSIGYYKRENGKDKINTPNQKHTKKRKTLIMRLNVCTGQYMFMGCKETFKNGINIIRVERSSTCIAY